jgi:hypothetical protein
MSPAEISAAHRFFAADCFNRTWELLEMPARSQDQDEEMLLLALSSLWHWRHREDVTPQNLSVGLWLVSRVYSLLGNAENALTFAERCREQSTNTGPFYLGFAYESLARAEFAARNLSTASSYLERARGYAEQVSDVEERTVLLADVDELAQRLSESYHAAGRSPG